MIRRQDDVIWRPVDGRVVGLDLRSSRYFSLNASAALLWERLQHDVGREELVEGLVEEFGIAAVDAERDVDAFVAELRTAGLLQG